jgi:hypothetical protein
MMCKLKNNCQMEEDSKSLDLDWSKPITSSASKYLIGYILMDIHRRPKRIHLPIERVRFIASALIFKIGII